MLSTPAFAFIPLPDQQALWAAKLSQELAKGPETYHIEGLVAEGARNWDLRNSWELAENNAKRIHILTTALEARGTRIYLMYLPMMAAYDGHPYARRNREIAGGSDAFSCARCLDVRDIVDPAQLRWVDGVHLDDRSAVLVVDALERKLSNAIE